MVPVTTDNPTPDALRGLEQAMDRANDLIGDVLREVADTGTPRPELRVLSGDLDGEETPPERRRRRLRVIRSR